MLYRKGERVVIRDWISMAEEFEVDEEGYIRCMCIFAPQMKYLCGTCFIIEEDIPEGSRQYIQHVENWAISTDMIRRLNINKRIA